jgi:hypothetical protein
MRRGRAPKGTFLSGRGVCGHDQLHRAHRAPDAGRRLTHVVALVHRSLRGPRVRPLRTHRNRRAVRDVPLPDAAQQRARLLLLARSRDGRADPPFRVVHHEVPGRPHRDEQHQISDLVRDSPLLRSGARAIAKSRALSRDAELGREARYHRARALSHRSARNRTASRGAR